MCQFVRRFGYIMGCAAALAISVDTAVLGQVPVAGTQPSVYPVPTGASNIPVGGAAPWIAPGYAPAVGPAYGATGYWTPGGYEGRVGSPYYYTPAQGYASGGQAYYGPDWNGTQGNSGGVPYGTNAGYGAQPFANQGLPPNPYYTHFGPGFYRGAEYGHYRFPYYSYRRPWYYPGHPSYNRDTNLPW